MIENIRTNLNVGVTNRTYRTQLKSSYTRVNRMINEIKDIENQIEQIKEFNTDLENGDYI